jgi:superfamily I DNA and/or RNA helicase
MLFQIISTILGIYLTILIGCVIFESLKYEKLVLSKGIKLFQSLHMSLLNLFVKPKKEKPVAVIKPTPKVMEEVRPIEEKTQEVQVSSPQMFQQITINDRERFLRGAGMAVLQFTDSGWDSLLRINEEYHLHDDYSSYELNALLEKGVWCKSERKSSNEILLNILAGSYIFYTMYTEDDKQRNSQSGSTSTGRKNSRFLVTKTVYARSVLNKWELESFLDYGVYVKSSWRVNKPSEKGKRPQEQYSDYSSELIQEIYKKQKSYSLNLQQDEEEYFEKLVQWKEFVELNEKAGKESAKKSELAYEHFKPSPDYAVEGNVFRFYIDQTPHALKPTDVVTFHGYYDQVRVHAKGTIRQVTKEFLDIRIMDHYHIDRIPSKGKLINDFNNRSYQIQLDTLSQMVEHNKPLSRLIEDPKSSIPPIQKDIKIKNEQIEANKVQVKAVQKALGTKDLFLIQGPPGTGKTSVITEIIEQFVSSGQKVLISSQSNLAVDNVFEKIGNHPGIRSVRCGKEEKILDTVIPFKLENRAVKMQGEIAQNVQAQLELDQEQIRLVNQHDHLLKELIRYYEKTEMLIQEITEWTNKQQHLLKHSNVPANVEKRKRLTMIDKQEDDRNRLRARNDLIDFKLDGYRQMAGKLNPLSKLWKIYIIGQKKRNSTKIQTLTDQVTSLKTSLDELHQQVEIEVKKSKDYLQASHHIVACQQQTEQLRAEIDDFIQTLPATIAGNFGSNMTLSEAKGQYQEISQLSDNVQSRSNLMSDWLEYLKTDEESLHNLLMENVDVIGSTCIGVATDHNLDGIEFDVAIIDEASRATVPETLVPMARAKKTILVGDHQQLPPTISHEIVALCDESEFSLPYKQSLFEQLIQQVNEESSILLSEQYRMNPLISNFISSSFYNGKYRAGKGTDEKVFPSLFFDKPLCFIDTSNYENKGESKFPKQGYSNELEAEFVIKALRQIVNDVKGSPQHGKIEVGVIAPYKKQKQLILSKVNEDKEIDLSLIDLEVETLDAFQGREKDIIIFSFTRSNRSGELGHTKELYRVNVGLSRAKKLLILIGDSTTLKKAKEEKINTVLNNLIQYILTSGNFKVVWTEDRIKEESK